MLGGTTPLGMGFLGENFLPEEIVEISAIIATPVISAQYCATVKMPWESEMSAFLTNANSFELTAFYDTVTRQHVNDAACFLTLRLNGVNVSGATALVMNNVPGSLGRYVGIVPSGVTLSPVRHIAQIEAFVLGSLVGHWEIPFTPKIRRGNEV